MHVIKIESKLLQAKCKSTRPPPPAPTGKQDQIDKGQRKKENVQEETLGAHEKKLINSDTDWRGHE